MRQKSQSVQVYNNLKPLQLTKLDYELCIYECQILRKKFLGIAKRFLYLFPDQIAICKEERKPIPDRQIPINNETRVSWTYKTSPKKDQKILKSIIFHVSPNQDFEYLGEDKVLRDLKEHVALYVFQTKIQDEYMAETIIDKGSYAVVLELVNIYTKKAFAAKCIDQKKILDKPNAPLQLSYEIQTMRLLSATGHPNILRLQELFIGNMNFYIVMELAQGGSLLGVMKRRETLFDRSEIRIIMKQLLDGLSYMHSFGLMHRDLKPENLLFLHKEDLNSLKIADFGLAQSVDEHPYIYPKCGTPGFVAPEVLNSQGDDAMYGVQCDVFSAGVILYILLTGEPLFDAKDRKELLEMNKRCEIDIDKTDPQLVNREERDLLKKMLAKNPAERITSKQCLDHPMLSDTQLEVRFQSEDFNYIESEFDVNQKENIANFMRKKMRCFQKNPFMALKRDALEHMNKVNLRESAVSMVIRSSLKLDKTSHENLSVLEQMGSFGTRQLDVVQEESKQR